MLLLSIFVYIFNPFLAGINTTHILFLCYLIKAMVDVNYRNLLMNRTLTKEVFRMFWFVIPVLLLAMLALLINETSDFSFILPLFSQLYKLLLGLFIYAHFLQKRRKNAIIYCVYAFVVQAILQVVSFFSPSINTFLNMFRDMRSVELGLTYYAGYRGLVVGSASFFSVSAAYAIMFVIIAEYWDKIYIGKYIKLLFLVIICFASISAGRTAFAGMAVATAVVLFIRLTETTTQRNLVTGKVRPRKSKNPIYIVLFFWVIGALLFVWLLDINGVLNFSISERIAEKISSFLRYALEFIYNFLNGDGFTTVSTDILKDMYFPVSIKTFVFGDGLYTAEFGGYYMKTDAGYMRQVLYFGIIGFLALVCFQLMFFSYKQNLKTKIYSYGIIILLFILHYKGEVIGYLHITQSILLLRMLSQIHEENEIREST